jgi:hypothetical protein
VCASRAQNSRKASNLVPKRGSEQVQVAKHPILSEQVPYPVTHSLSQALGDFQRDFHAKSRRFFDVASGSSCQGWGAERLGGEEKSIRRVCADVSRFRVASRVVLCGVECIGSL